MKVSKSIKIWGYPNAIPDVNPNRNSLAYAVNVFLCASRRGTSIAMYALEWSHAVLAIPSTVLVQ